MPIAISWQRPKSKEAEGLPLPLAHGLNIQNNLLSYFDIRDE